MRMKNILVALVAVGLSAVMAQAEQKIATINLKTVFDGYYKTKQSDALVKDRQTEFEKERKKMEEDYKKANEAYKKQIDSAMDPAISTEEKDKRRKDADGKLMEIKEIEQSVRQFDQQFRVKISEDIKRMRDKILGEIREVITIKAKAGAYNLVIDTAAESNNQTPIVLYTSGTPDVTDEVLVDLNKTAGTGTEEKK